MTESEDKKIERLLNLFETLPSDKQAWLTRLAEEMAMCSILEKRKININR